MATARVHAHAFENVYELSGVVAVRDAEVGMQEGTEAMGRCHALARPARGDHADWHAWACTGLVLGVSVPANVVQAFSWEGYWHE